MDFDVIDRFVYETDLLTDRIFWAADEARNGFLAREAEETDPEDEG